MRSYFTMNALSILSIAAMTVGCGVEIDGVEYQADLAAFEAESAVSPSTPGATDDLTTNPQSLVSYCVVDSPNANAEEWISHITLGAIDNASGASATSYSDFTNLSTELVMGTSATLGVQAAFGGLIQARTEYWKAWIDLNEDGVFNDTAFGTPGSERLFPTFATTSSDPGAVNFTVPAAASPGLKRLRIRMTRLPAVRSSWQSPCFNTSGEIEDYTVNLR